MEKKFLTYSKRTIRPFGGVDPEIRGLREEASRTSLQGTLSNSLTVTERSIKRADALYQKAQEKEEAMAQWLRDEENHRQQLERRMLNRSLSVRQQSFQEEWAEKRKDLQEEIARMQAEAQESCDAEQHHLEHRLSKQRLKPVKFSPEVRDRLIQTTKLCNAHEYQQAIYEISLLKDKRAEDLQRWEGHNRHLKEVERQLLERRVQQELRANEERCTVQKHRFEREHAAAREVLALSCRNLTKDLEAAFQREWHTRPEVPISAKVSSKSRTQTSATFLGSRLQESVVGTYDLPSVSQLHFEGEMLDGTIRDQAVADKLSPTASRSPAPAAGSPTPSSPPPRSSP
eukprot:CAMPEP_0113697648 /NCGR_PEP_ID=MMETSP0038_2-20120614/22253_1 /TAXON_ID=2898 /ORGANISM="Cryptomonas paramecium" /LENGTH=343 /DNA_ID=CAMNT_0000620687 /DNA_START=46 /DNA_END=1073 /DNA_ORIENTATION=- /assembly_acc=CAM_ASM_000170